MTVRLIPFATASRIRRGIIQSSFRLNQRGASQQKAPVGDYKGLHFNTIVG